MFKRIFLFLLTNILVIATISIITSVLGLHHYLSANGINYQQLIIFCALWGMGGAFISLLLSKVMAKYAMGVVIINSKTATNDERFLLDIIQNYTRRLALPKMPEVGIYRSPEINAFATGPSKGNALVAVSSGLLASMKQDEIDGVIGHEMTHIANGDMVTMTLLQGVINAFVLFLSRIIAYAVSMALSKNDREEGPSFLMYNLLIIVFDICFTILGSIVVASFSRWREYRADLGGARLAGKEKMINALKRLQTAYGRQDDRAPSMAAFKINHPSKSNWLELFSSHPPLEKRIARLMGNNI